MRFKSKTGQKITTAILTCGKLTILEKEICDNKNTKGER